MDITISIPNDKIDVVRNNLELLANTEIIMSNCNVSIKIQIPEKTLNDLEYTKLILRLMLRKIITLAKYNQDSENYRTSINEIQVPAPQELID